MSHHTPGPWLAQQRTWQRGNVSVFAPKFGRAPYGACVAFIPCSEGVGGADGALANAHLIAAAPDLLEALQAIVKSLADQDDEGLIEHAQQMIDARAAIAKATGEQT